jgi:hypothetical protein
VPNEQFINQLLTKHLAIAVSLKRYNGGKIIHPDKVMSNLSEDQAGYFRALLHWGIVSPLLLLAKILTEKISPKSIAN